MELAQELIDAIVDYLADDMSTLNQCMLVSHAHHVSCRRYIFAEVCLLPLEERLRWKPEQVVANTCHIFHRLLSSAPEIALLVRELHISDTFVPDHILNKPMPPLMSMDELRVAIVNGDIPLPGGDYDEDDTYMPSGKRQYFTEWFRREPTFSPVLSSLVNLQYLSFSGKGIRWANIPFENREALRAVFQLPTLNRLKLSWLLFEPGDLQTMFKEPPSFTQFDFTLNAFPRSHIYSWLPEIEEPLDEAAPNPSPVKTPPTFLNTLRLSSYKDQLTIGPFVKYLRSPDTLLSIKRLRTLIIEENDRESVSDINLVLNDASKTLEYLECAPDVYSERSRIHAFTHSL